MVSTHATAALMHAGRHDLHRTDYVCAHCNKVVHSSDPLLYVTLNTMPGSPTKVDTVFSTDVLAFYNSLRAHQPKISREGFLETLMAADDRQPCGSSYDRSDKILR